MILLWFHSVGELHEDVAYDGSTTSQFVASFIPRTEARGCSVPDDFLCGPCCELIEGFPGLNQVTSYRTKEEETPGIPCVDGVLMNVKSINSNHHGGISSESFTECKAADEGEEVSD